jgi:hypothetical protein
LTNPLTVIEQLTYLLFIRSLDEKELDNERMDALTLHSRSEWAVPYAETYPGNDGEDRCSSARGASM